jgi:hypothetical protein
MVFQLLSSEAFRYSGELYIVVFEALQMLYKTYMASSGLDE